MKLNEKQAALLLVMEASLPQSIMVDYDAPWPISTSTLKALERRGLVDRKNDHFWQLTEAGKIKCQEYEQIEIPSTYGTGRGDVCFWIDKTEWRPTPGRRT